MPAYPGCPEKVAIPCTGNGFSITVSQKLDFLTD